jgi:hypothetical protein
MPHLCTSAFRTLALVGAALAVIAAPASAQELPTAEQVVVRHLQAIGGMQALTAQQYRHTRERLSEPGRVLSSTREVYQAREGNKYVMRMDALGVGVSSMGYDGRTTWSSNPVSGPSIRPDTAMNAALNQFDFEWNINFARLFRSMETVGRDTANGESCIQVRMISPRGDEVVNCFADDDGILIAATGRMASRMGDIRYRATFSDYRVFDGINMPTLTTMSMSIPMDDRTREIMGKDAGAQRGEIRLLSVSNRPIDASVFALPPEVAALKAN